MGQRWQGVLSLGLYAGSQLLLAPRGHLMRLYFFQRCPHVVRRGLCHRGGHGQDHFGESASALLPFQPQQPPLARIGRRGVFHPGKPAPQHLQHPNGGPQTRRCFQHELQVPPHHPHPVMVTPRGRQLRLDRGGHGPFRWWFFLVPPVPVPVRQSAVSVPWPVIATGADASRLPAPDSPVACSAPWPPHIWPSSHHDSEQRTATISSEDSCTDPHPCSPTSECSLPFHGQPQKTAQ